MSVKNKNSIRVDQRQLPEHQRIKRNFFIRHQSVYELFRAQAKKFPRKTFAIFPESNRTFSYQKLDQEITKRSRYLKGRGLVRGNRVCLVIPTSPDFLMFYFAALREGVVVVPINPDLSPTEIAYIVMDSQAKAVFYHQSVAKKIAEARKTPGLNRTAFINAAAVKPRASLKKTEAPEVYYHDEAVIVYTSGTTGKPKGAVLSHLNLLVDSQVISEWFRFTPQTRTLCILPLFHNNGQVITLLAPLSVGGSTVMVPAKTSLKLFWSLIKKYRVSWTSVMPSILAIVLGAKLERKDSSLVGIICGGQVLNEEVKNQFESKFRVPIFEGYGLTETTSFASFNRFPANQRRAGTVGRALPCNDIAILDENGKEVARDEEGEICIRGLNVMIGYFGLTEINRRDLRGGFFHSGDYGCLDKDGNVYFKTRKDYLISKGGEKIYPSEIENVLFAHPAVDECAVIGVPDKFLGQDIVAFVKLNDDCAEVTLKEFLDGKLAHYKYPKTIIIVNRLADLGEIPKGPTKKVLYRVLVEYYQQSFLQS